MKLNQPKKQNSPYLILVPILLICSVLLGGCIPSQIKAPQITQGAQGPQLTGKFIWYDIFTNDISGTATFYSELFGWSFQDIPEGNGQFKTIFQDGHPIGNAITITKQQNKDSDGQWLSYMSVPDVDNAVQIVKKNKGSVHTAAKQLPERGRIAVVRDSEGAIFALLHSSSGDPADDDLQYSTWIGSELWTHDMENSRTFYTDIAGYEEKLVPLSSGDTYHFLMRDGQPRAGIAQLHWEEVEPIWVPYVGIEDITTTISTAINLGATLIMEPDPDFPEISVAILADPSGAIFGIQQIDTNPSPEGDKQ